MSNHCSIIQLATLLNTTAISLKVSLHQQMLLDLNQSWHCLILLAEAFQVLSWVEGLPILSIGDSRE